MYTCDRPLCKALRRASEIYLCLPRGDWRGPYWELWFMAEFLDRMANPKTQRQREFAKRYKGSRINRAPTNGSAG